MPIELAIYDIQGRKIETLVDGIYPAGRHQFQWIIAKSQNRLANGIYIYQLKSRKATRHNFLQLIW